MKRKLLIITLFYLTTMNAYASDISNMSKEELCKTLASFYGNGGYKQRQWFSVIEEIRKRKYGLRCKEIAELYIMAAKPNGAIPFKEKLEEMFGPTPRLLAEDHFLSTDSTQE